MCELLRGLEVVCGILAVTVGSSSGVCQEWEDCEGGLDMVIGSWSWGQSSLCLDMGALALSLLHFWEEQRVTASIFMYIETYEKSL